MPTSEGKLVPIRAVCAMYNLNPNTLRTWERRYGIVKPRRSDGGHRGYCDADLASIETMLRLLQEGKAPGEAAELTLNRQSRPEVPAAPQAAGLRGKFRRAVEHLDTQNCVEVCRGVLSQLGYQAAVEQVLFPELAYWGERWAKTARMVAEEHLASLTVRSMLIETLHAHGNLPAGSRAVTLACAPGEQHDLPLLHVANLLRQESGFRPLLLVSGLPVGEMIAASEASGALAIVLSATLTPRPEVVRSWINEISRAGWEDRTILVGSGFAHSRVFSETAVKAAPGNYRQLVKLLARMGATV